MLAAIVDAREAARGHEAVIVSHQLPVWTARPPARGQAAVARPAPAPVLPRVADQPHLRRRRAGVDGLQRARGRAAARRQQDGGRMSGGSSAAWPLRCSRCGLAALQLRQQLHCGAGALGRPARATSPATARSSGSRRADRGTALTLSGTTLTARPWSVARRQGQGRRPQRLGLLVRARAWPRRPTCRRPGWPTPRPGKPVQFMGINYRDPSPDTAPGVPAGEQGHLPLPGRRRRAHPAGAARQGGQHPDHAGPRPAGPAGRTGRRAGLTAPRSRPRRRRRSAKARDARPRRQRPSTAGAAAAGPACWPLAAGLVSFASPCVLPLVPGFLGYVTGLSDVALEKRAAAGCSSARCSSCSASPSSSSPSRRPPRRLGGLLLSTGCC